MRAVASRRHHDEAHLPLTDKVATALPVVVATALPATNTALRRSEDDAAVHSDDTLSGFPLGLSRALVSSTRVFPVRYWILDNSGSMSTGDSSRLLTTPDGDVKFVRATRWQELMDAAVAAAEVSCAIGCEMHMHLLNRTAGGLQFLTISPSYQEKVAASPVPLQRIGDDSDKPVRRGVVSSEVDLPALRQLLLQASPSGTTPLTEAIERVTALLRPRAEALHAAGQQAVVTLATDGMPDAPASFTRAMQRLAALNCVWIVVRLCTSDRAVIDYWAELDAALEAPLEVRSRCLRGSEPAANAAAYAGCAVMLVPRRGPSRPPPSPPRTACLLVPPSPGALRHPVRGGRGARAQRVADLRAGAAPRARGGAA